LADSFAAAHDEGTLPIDHRTWRLNDDGADVVVLDCRLEWDPGSRMADSRKRSWRAEVRTAAATISVIGCVLVIAGAAVLPLWIHVGLGPPGRTIDASALFVVLERTQALSSCGVFLIAAGAAVWTVILPNGTQAVIWSRAASALLAVAMLALLVGFRGKSLAEIASLTGGKIAYASATLALLSLAALHVRRWRRTSL
jgi:hypothetical protein